MNQSSAEDDAEEEHERAAPRRPASTPARGRRGAWRRGRAAWPGGSPSPGARRRTRRPHATTSRDHERHRRSRAPIGRAAPSATAAESDCRHRRPPAGRDRRRRRRWWPISSTVRAARRHRWPTERGRGAQSAVTRAACSRLGRVAARRRTEGVGSVEVGPVVERADPGLVGAESARRSRCLVVVGLEAGPCRRRQHRRLRRPRGPDDDHASRSSSAVGRRRRRLGHLAGGRLGPVRQRPRVLRAEAQRRLVARADDAHRLRGLARRRRERRVDLVVSVRPEAAVVVRAVAARHRRS